MVTYKNGNLLESNCSIICHQVNCQGVMGSGIAKQLRDKWPEVFDSYCNFLQYNYMNGICRYSYDFLGRCLLTQCNEKGTSNFQFIANFFSQDKYLPRAICHTDYDAFRKCCKQLKLQIKEVLLVSYKYKFKKETLTIGFPYKIGCGLAGGDWSIISKIIEEELGNEFNVELYQYNT